MCHPAIPVEQMSPEQRADWEAVMEIHRRHTRKERERGSFRIPVVAENGAYQVLYSVPDEPIVPQSSF
jgi:hypothetical protein